MSLLWTLAMSQVKSRIVAAMSAKDGSHPAAIIMLPEPIMSAKDGNFLIRLLACDHRFGDQAVRAPPGHAQHLT